MDQKAAVVAALSGAAAAAIIFTILSVIGAIPW